MLASIFNNYKLSNTQVVIIKSKSKHTLVSFKDGKLIISNYWHKKMLGRKIKNDTGAGDAFAGGFIASMLSTRLLIHQPIPIRVGAISAMARMKCYEEPFSAIASETSSYINMIQKDKMYNFKQVVVLVLGEIKKQVPTFLIGIITGIIASLFVWWIQWLCE